MLVIVNESYAGAVKLLPASLRTVAATLLPEAQLRAEELRLRAGFAMSVVLPQGEVTLGDVPLTPRDLDMVVEIATSASAHAVRETVRAGFVNAPGGYRLGLCGNVTLGEDGGAISGFGAVSSIAVRIPREQSGFADKIALATGGEIPSTLIIAPPGVGKTTLLRDLVRLCSDGCAPLGVAPQRIGLCDERGEVAGVVNGAAQMSVGRHTDILTGAPKAQATMMLVRTMNLQIVALDEVTSPRDAAAIEYAANCGVRLFATVHAASVDELRRKPLYAQMLASRVFELAVTLRKIDGKREYEVVRL